MNARRLILLSPYKIPTQSSLYVGDEEVAAFLNGLAALWHPAALALTIPDPKPVVPENTEAPAGEIGPDDYTPPEEDPPISEETADPRSGRIHFPSIESPYDYETPEAGLIFALPDNPTLTLPEEWESKARAAGATVFKATPDRAQTVANLLEALRPHLAENQRFLLDLEHRQVAAFQALGFGLSQLEALFEAMTHENVLDFADFANDIALALASISDSETSRSHLQAAAERLLVARETVYPVGMYVVDLVLPDQESGPSWPGAGDREQPINLVASSSLLERWAKERPEILANLKSKTAEEKIEICGAGYLEREDDLLPLESQVWNLLHGRQLYQELLERDPRIFARRRFGYSPILPSLLQNVGLSHAILLTFDDSVIPAHRPVAVSWPAADGKQVDAFTRIPHPAASVQTGFHLAFHLHETIMQDQAATVALLHQAKPAAPWYEDWLELTSLAPVLGKWTTISNYFSESSSGDYAPTPSPDEFHGNHLIERAGDPGADGAALKKAATTAHPVSWFAAFARGRRRVDAAWTLAALMRGIGGEVPPKEDRPFDTALTELENRFEAGEALGQGAIALMQQHAADALAQRLVSKGQEGQPGFLLLNPCSFNRRVAVDLPGVEGGCPVGGFVKASQMDGETARVVVEVPALGFAWIPSRGVPVPAVPPSRMRLADERCVRNEFFEAEVDPATGGLRAVRDLRTRMSRLGQQLVFNPGSSMRVQKIQTTSAGPALGEIIAEGALLDGQEQVLATYRQRLRAWLGRPLLEMHIEIYPVKLPEGYPWHAYFASRFAWRDERATVLRGSDGLASVTTHTRPETPDFLEIRVGRQNTILFPGGLPFHQRHGGRMLDVILVPPGETNQVFEIGISLDREHPAQTALGLISPTPLVVTDRGPPHIGPSGWLGHLDAPNLVMTSLRPANEGNSLVARLLEVASHAGPVEFRFPRDPVRAALVDGLGNHLLDATVQGDTVQFEVAANDLIQLRVDFR
jgi:hypothetical protein